MEPDRSAIYEQLVATLHEVLSCSGIAVLTRDDAGITILAQHGTPALPALVEASPSFTRFFEHLASTREPVLALHSLAGLPTPGFGRDWLALPLVAANTLYGYISLQGEFDSASVLRAHAVMLQAAHALHWLDRWQTTQIQQEQLRDLDTQIQHAPDQASALALIVDTSMALTHASHGCIFANNQGRAVMLARRGYSPEEAVLVQQIPPSLEHGLSGRAFRERAPARSDDIDHDPQALPALASTRSQLIIPIVAGEQSLGIIDLQSPALAAFAQADITLLQSLGQFAAVAMKHHGARALAPASETEIIAEHDLLLSSRLAVVSDLAAGVAHEINNPLTTILGYTHLLLRNQGLPQAAHDDISHIMVEGQRIAALVERFLRFAQPSSGGKIPLPIDQPLNEALGLLRNRVNESGIQLTLDLPAVIPMVLGQAGQLEQAFLELLQNAIEAMSTCDQRRLDIGIVEQSEWVRVTISDTGRGIRPDLLTRVFEPGFTTKVDKGISRGLGLGLYAVHMITQDHWGRVEVQSKVWRGSTFTVCLPAI